MVAGEPHNQSLRPAHALPLLNLEPLLGRALAAQPRTLCGGGVQ